jgi:tight adherence protein B
VTATTGSALPAILLALAVLAVPAAGGAARLRLRRLTLDRRARQEAEGAGSPGPGRGPGGDRHLDVAALAEHLAGAMRAGLPPGRVWATLAARPGAGARTAEGVLPWIELGVPSGRALWEAARVSRGSPLLPLVVALDVCDRTGAPPGEVLDGLVAALRAQDAAAHETAVALAAPRATVRVMTALPAVGLGMAALLGADIVHVLVGTPIGRGCLALGGALWAAGHWWIGRLVAAAGASRRASGHGHPAGEVGR